MQEAVTFNGFLHESGKQISIQIPASAYIQLGEEGDYGKGSPCSWNGSYPFG